MKLRRNVLPPAPLAQNSETTEIKVWAPWAVVAVLWRIGLQFELASGHQLDIVSDLPGTYTKWINADEPFDVLIATPDVIDELTRTGKIAVETHATLCRSIIGVEVRAGMPKPDISSVEAFRRTLFAAESIAFLKVGGGLYVQRMLERIEVYDDIKSKITRPDTDIVSELVAKGDVELGIVNIGQILTTAGVQLVGPLPTELQSFVVFSAGVSANSRYREAAQCLIQFLTGPKALAIMKSHGMEPE